ncbi:hypothetical protein AB0F85_32030 [Nocardia fluminea]|uniref:TRADD-N-associated membrane domain-containing protein n=1 Tax=Nocardia fluminea TaxID=134984 RepID=UPI0033F6704D
MTRGDDHPLTSFERTTGLVALLIPTVAQLSTEMRQALWTPTKHSLDAHMATRSGAPTSDSDPADTQPKSGTCDAALLVSANLPLLPKTDQENISIQIIKSAEDVANNIRSERIRQAKFSFNAALTLAAIGVLLVFIGCGFFLAGIVTAGVLASSASAVTEIVSALLFALNKQANDRLDRVNADLARISEFVLTRELIETISDAKSRDQALNRAIQGIKR